LDINPLSGVFHRELLKNSRNSAMHTFAFDLTGKHNIFVFNLNKQFAISCLFTGVSRSYIIIQNNTFAILQQNLSGYIFIFYSSLPETVFKIPVLIVYATND
jgi:hypothetical protein